MTTTQLEQRKPDAYAIEDIRLAYESGVNLWIYEGELCWSRFNVMMVANSIIIATLGFTTTSDKASFIFSYGMPVIGLLLCFSWSMMMHRAFDYHEYWRLSTRELEDLLPSRSVRMVSRVYSFAAGKPIDLKYEDQVQTIRMKWLSRYTTGRATSQFMILMFAVFYAMFFVQLFQ